MPVGQTAEAIKGRGLTKTRGKLQAETCRSLCRHADRYADVQIVTESFNQSPGELAS